MKAAIYVRVSTGHQTHDSQLTELRAYCERRGWQNPKEYADRVSGAKFTRQGLDALMADVRRGRVDVVLWFKLDRMGRSLPHLAQLVGEMSAHGVALVCASQGIDTSNDNPAGRLQLNVLMAVAQFEREIIRERVMAGLAAARANGVKLGRKATLQDRAEEVRRLKREGLGVRAIAKALGMPPSSVSVILNRQ